MSLDQPLAKLMVLWGVPGTGKSTFARWLAKTHGFTHAETDAGADVEQAVTLAQQDHPVVIEYGMFVGPGSIGAVRTWRSLGAQPWWFDGNRLAAYSAWRAENRRAGRSFRDDKWDEVVGVINASWPHVEKLFGSERILRTIEGGPKLVPPEEIYAAMQQVIAAETG